MYFKDSIILKSFYGLHGTLLSLENELQVLRDSHNMGFSILLSLLKRWGLCFQFWHYFFSPLLLNAHVATYLYCITKGLLNKCGSDLW